MKIIIEKYVCDICKKEVNANDRHYMINLGSSDNWTDENKIGEDAIQKDLCHECYKTIAQLIGVESAAKKQIPTKESCDGRKHPYDKETIKELWARGLTQKAIADRLHLKAHQVRYVIGKLTEEEKSKLIDAFAPHKNGIQEEPKIGMKVITDSEGCVISIE